MQSISNGTLVTLTLVALAAAAVALAASVALAVALKGIRGRYAQLLAGGPEGEDILLAVDRHLAAVERLQATTELLGREVAGLRQRISTLVQPVGLTRYDAFDDIGGRLSFSAAFLNEAGDGVVLTGINSRGETRAYAKPIEGGGSVHNLSDEERTAIELARGGGVQVAGLGA